MTKSAYLTGARPVLGAMGACGLMLLACSWFVLAPGDLGAAQDVGGPTPVRIDGLTSAPAGRAEPQAKRVRKSRARAVEVKQRAAARRFAAPVQITTPGPVPANTQAPTTPPVAQSAVAAPSPPPAPASDPPAVTPTLPAPTGDLPKVTVPPVSLPSIPVVPAPDVTTMTAPLGLP